jgi:hypothetical protein
MNDIESGSRDFRIWMRAHRPANHNQPARILRNYGDVHCRGTQADSLNSSELFRRQVEAEEVRLFRVGQIPEGVQIYRQEVVDSALALSARLPPGLVGQKEQEDESPRWPKQQLELRSYEPPQFYCRFMSMPHGSYVGIGGRLLFYCRVVQPDQNRNVIGPQLQEIDE